MKYLNIQTVILGAVFKYAEPGIAFGHTLKGIPQLVPDREGPEYLFRKQAAMLRTIVQHMRPYATSLRDLTLDRVDFPETMHPQLYAYLRSASVAGIGAPFDRAYSNSSSPEYINAHINFCNHYNLDAQEALQTIKLGDELTYLLNVTDGGDSADTLSKARITELAGASITAMDRYGQPFLLTHSYVTTPPFHLPNFDFSRVL